ncbi:PREDICTED: uncharacterized protein LOC105366860 [Ceratosolen solmsi marchali]|uniref:Uncharacterized protein LOC105366860 n=1 Tax=Ceratosolen solmsi marchali TaxID=326594 RepID=A0AAJ6YT19_9HYME|nr:PREDICTED: uncharacterized protein LOC105366860 [Ceratosolen solmsi marchali]
MYAIFRIQKVSDVSCMVMREDRMPSLPGSRQSSLCVKNLNFSDSDMFKTNCNNQFHRSTSGTTISSFNDQNDIETKNNRNRTNSKVKLLVRSHAMKESTSPPRKAQNDSVSSIQNRLLMDNETANNVTSTVSTISNIKKSTLKKFVYGINLTSNISNSNENNKQQSLNNEAICNSNFSARCQSPKKMKNLRINRIALHNDSSSSFQAHQKTIRSPISNNKSECQKSHQNNVNTSLTCNNCVKNDQLGRLDLLQTSKSPSKNQNSQKHMQNNKKNEQCRSNILSICNNQDSIECGNVSNNRSDSRYKLKNQNPFNQNSYESVSPLLSRDNSTELYTDSTGIDLEQFIADTINRNQKDRTVLLKIEKDLIDFVKDKQKISHKFPNMSSYNRMLVHRVAAYFGMEHNVDQSGLSVIVTRTKNMRIPETRFKEHIHNDLLLVEEPRRSILKRDSNSFEDSFNFKFHDRTSGEFCRRSKSFEEREEEYERARRRIFKESSSENDEVTSWPYWSSSESSETSIKYRLLHPSNHSIRQARLSKGEALDGKHLFHSNILRPSVSKSFSFGGYTRGVLSKDSSIMSTHSTGRHLIKQESSTSMCSRLSPSNSEYESQIQRREMTIPTSLSSSPVPSNLCNQLQISSQDLVIPESNSQTVIWVISSMSSVPPGSIIINPQTNQPYMNQDGSLYRFDPNNPPKFFIKKAETRDLNASLKICEPSESYKTILNNKNDYGKRQELQILKHNYKSCFNATKKATMTTLTTTMATNTTHLTSSITSPSLAFKSLPSLPQPSLLFYERQHQSKLHSQLHLHQHQSQGAVQQQQSLIRAVTIQSCNRGQAVQPYAPDVPKSEPYSQSIYQHNVTQQTVMMNQHPMYGVPSILKNRQEDIFNQNHLYTNYTLPIQYSSRPQSADITELSNYFMGMNVYDQCGAGNNHTFTHPYTQLTPRINETLTSFQPMQSNFWQTSTNQILPQQTMYFAPSLGNTIFLNKNQNDRQVSQQRLTSSYSINLQTMPTISQSNGKIIDIINYVNSCRVPYKSISTVSPNSNEYLCQPPIHTVPAYYPRQSVIHPSSVIYRVSTPPNSNQLIKGVHTLTPTNKSLTPAYELYGIRSGDQITQTMSHYPLPMYQGVHIIQDMRLIHPGVSTNTRFQCTPVQSSLVTQGCCPISYKPISCLSNTSSNKTSPFLDGKYFRNSKSDNHSSESTVIQNEIR